MTLYSKNKDFYNLLIIFTFRFCSYIIQHPITIKKFLLDCLILSIVIFSFIFISKIFNNKIYNYLKKKPLKLSKKQIKQYPIIIQYTPPKWINSAEAGLIFNWRAEISDIISLIYRWASKRYISIEDYCDQHETKWKRNFNKILIKKLCDFS